MMSGRMASGRIEGDAAHVVDDGGFEHPYKLTYAASAGAVDGETGEADGAWIIWLPDGCLVIDGETVDLTANLTAANNYPEGWYDLTDIFDGTDPDEFDLYLDASKDDPKFVTAQEDAENPVLIAKVNGKAVKGVVESALVIGAGVLLPWKVRLFDVTSGGSTSKHVGVWIPQYAAVQVHENVWDGAWHVGKWYGGSDSYVGSVLADATAKESASGVWADAGVWDGSSTKYVTVQIDAGPAGSAPAIRIWNLGLVSSAPSSSWVSGGALLHFYLDNLIVAKVGDGGVDQYMIGSQIIQHNNGGSGGGGGGGDEDTGVTSLNGLTGDVTIVPGANTSVAADGQSIVIDCTGGGGGGMFSWTAATRTIGPGGCMVGRKWYTASGTGSGMPDGLYQLKITLSSSGATCQVVSGVSLGTSPSGDISYIPIYEINNAKIAADYRGAFVVPAYE